MGYGTLNKNRETDYFVYVCGGSQVAMFEKSSHRALKLMVYLITLSAALKS